MWRLFGVYIVFFGKVVRVVGGKLGFLVVKGKVLRIEVVLIIGIFLDIF